jgi:ATP-binding protein involved in chromosome partitioning
VSTRAARFVVAVGSGKGGVGKSTVCLNLALALRRRGWNVGLLDADLYGPDIPLLVNLTRKQEAERWDFWRRGDVRLVPVEHEGLQMMSVGFLLAERQALTMAAPLLTAALRQLVEHVDWRDLDVLLIDLPPGTADLQQQLLQVVVLSGVVVVVGPQDVAHVDGRKFVDFLAAARVRILGGVENMAGLDCPHCGERIDVFRPVAPERSLWSAQAPLLGRIPLDPALAGHRPTAQQRAFDDIAAQLVHALDAPTAV